MCINGGEIISFNRSAAGGWMTRETKPAFRRIAARSHLFFEGDERTQLFVIESGWVKLYRTLIDGERQIVGFCNGGSLLGVEGEGDYLNGCQAITDVTVRVLPLSQLPEMCGREPDLAIQLLQQAGRQLGTAQTHLTTVGVRTAEQQLAVFLLAFADHAGAAGGEFDLPVKRIEMAEFLGVRLETVSRKMSEFQKNNWIRMTSLYHCRLLNRHALEYLAEGGEGIDANWAQLAH